MIFIVSSSALGKFHNKMALQNFTRLNGLKIAVFTSSYTKVPVSETSLAACMARLAIRSPHRRSPRRRSAANNLANQRGFPRRIFVLRIANFEVSSQIKFTAVFNHIIK